MSEKLDIDEFYSRIGDVMSYIEDLDDEDFKLTVEGVAVGIARHGGLEVREFNELLRLFFVAALGLNPPYGRLDLAIEILGDTIVSAFQMSGCECLPYSFGDSESYIELLKQTDDQDILKEPFLMNVFQAIAGCVNARFKDEFDGNELSIEIFKEGRERFLESLKTN